MAPTMPYTTVIDVDAAFGQVTVLRQDAEYSVLVNGELKHPHCSPEDVIRALGHYLQSTGCVRPSL